MRRASSARVSSLEASYIDWGRREGERGGQRGGQRTNRGLSSRNAVLGFTDLEQMLARSADPKKPTGGSGRESHFEAFFKLGQPVTHGSPRGAREGENQHTDDEDASARPPLQQGHDCGSIERVGAKRKDVCITKLLLRMRGRNGGFL